jgi:hypothetical protein
MRQVGVFNSNDMSKSNAAVSLASRCSLAAAVSAHIPPRKSTLSTYPFKDQVALSFSLFNNKKKKLSPFQFSIPILIIYNIKNINDGYLERLISGPTCIVMDVDGWTGNFKSNHMT